LAKLISQTLGLLASIEAYRPTISFFLFGSMPYECGYNFLWFKEKCKAKNIVLVVQANINPILIQLFF